MTPEKDAPATGVDKAARTLGRPQYHLRVSPESLRPDPARAAPVMLLPGDPARVDRVLAACDEGTGREVAYFREYRSAVGEYAGLPVGGCSTGIGCPSAAIAVEELANAGVGTVIRIGSTAALQPGMAPGDLVVNTGAMKNEGTSRMYLPDRFPAVPDLELTTALVRAARQVAAERGIGVHVGLGVSSDAFYAETPELVRELSGYGLLHMDMEASAIYTVAHLRGLRAGVVCAVSGNLVTDDVEYETDHSALAGGWDAAVQVALRAAVAVADLPS